MAKAAPVSTMAVLDWLEARRRRSGLAFTHIDWETCTGWRLSDGRLSHDTGGFFSVVGIETHSADAHLDRLALPIIDQPEIGILGFLVRAGAAGHDWLLQAKAEPGNVGGVQIAPSVQATYSNYMRRHGGAPTRFLDHMLPEGSAAGALADVRQSEQGGMFLNKYNRNVAVLCADDPGVESDGAWKWIASAALREVLLRDYAVNTDARSVIVSAPWATIGGGGGPFAGGGDAWRDQLSASYADTHTSEAIRGLEAARARTTLETRVVALDALPHCRVDSREILATDRSPALHVRPYAVSAADREVTSWRQPLMGRDSIETAALLCAERDGSLRFFLRFSAEPGFANRVQFGPSYQSDSFSPHPHWLPAALASPDAHIRAAVAQSDEGGRFMRCVTNYQIVECSSRATGDDDACGAWVGLGALERLAAISGALTNEARSAISLLLAWA